MIGTLIFSAGLFFSSPPVAVTCCLRKKVRQPPGRENRRGPNPGSLQSEFRQTGARPPWRCGPRRHYCRRHSTPYRRVGTGNAATRITGLLHDATGGQVPMPATGVVVAAGAWLILVSGIRKRLPHCTLAAESSALQSEAVRMKSRPA